MFHFWVRPTDDTMLIIARHWLLQIRRPWELCRAPEEERVNQKCDEFTVIFQIGTFVLLWIAIDPRIDNPNSSGRMI